MKRTKDQLKTLAVLLLLALVAKSMGSEAETSATATGNRGRSGTAAATARYQGDVGFARTNTTTGRINASRAVALGVDHNGLSLSVSTAIAPNSGPALATTFNVSIGTRGDVSHSVGRTVATGGASRTVSAGGSTSTATRYSSGTAVAQASGRTSFGGVVRSQTRSVQQPPRALTRRVIWRP